MSIMDWGILNYEALAGMDLEGEDTVNASWQACLLLSGNILCLGLVGLYIPWDKEDL